MMGICNNCGNDKKYVSYIEVFRDGTEVTLLVCDECRGVYSWTECAQNATRQTWASYWMRKPLRQYATSAEIKTMSVVKQARALSCRTYGNNHNRQSTVVLPVATSLIVVLSAFLLALSSGCSHNMGSACHPSLWRAHILSISSVRSHTCCLFQMAFQPCIWSRFPCTP